jgi:glycosyltransferase involved in cell wall biosynthesis
MVRRLTIRKRLISPQLVNPSLATETDLARVRGKLGRDFPWLLEDGWGVEYWGFRPDGIRSAEGRRFVSAGPRLPSVPLPTAVIAALAWTCHVFLALARPHAGIVVAPAPYSAAGLSFARLFRRSGPPLIVRVMGSTSSKALLVHREVLGFRILSAIENFVLRRADLVVPMGAFTESIAFRARVDPGRILPLPFPTAWRRPYAASSDGEPDPLRVVCAARLVPEKGIDVLLRAWQSVVREVPNAKLVIAGDGSARASLERLARDLEIERCIRFRGWLSADEMSRFFLGAAITVLPSKVEEGLGMALVEGGLAGCALIGSDLGGIRDIIEPEESGFVVPPEDPVALAAALARCLKDPMLARRMGAGAKVRAERYLASRDVQVERLRAAVNWFRGDWRP